MTIEDAQKRVDEWIKTYGVRYFNEPDEHGMPDRRGGRTGTRHSTPVRRTELQARRKINIGEEIADVMWVLICLANCIGTDITAELEKAFAKKTARDKDRHRNNPKLK